MSRAHFTQTLRVVAVALIRLLALELACLLETLGEHRSLRDRRQNRAPRFTRMTTVTKAALLGERVYLRKAAASELGVVVREQGEFTHARRVEQQPAPRKRE